MTLPDPAPDTGDCFVRYEEKGTYLAETTSIGNLYILQQALDCYEAAKAEPTTSMKKLAVAKVIIARYGIFKRVNTLSDVSFKQLLHDADIIPYPKQLLNLYLTLGDIVKSSKEALPIEEGPLPPVQALSNYYRPTDPNTDIIVDVSLAYSLNGRRQSKHIIVKFRSERDYEQLSDSMFELSYEWFLQFMPENAEFEGMETYGYVDPLLTLSMSSFLPISILKMRMRMKVGKGKKWGRGKILLETVPNFYYELCLLNKQK